MIEKLPEVPDTYPTKALVSKVEARRHTARILGACSRLHVDIQEWQVLCKDAYERGVHLALGYKSWAAYAEKEFGMSESQAHRALDRGRVIAALKDLGVARPNEIVSGRQAAVLAKDPTAMPEIAAAIETGTPPKQAVRGAANRRRTHSQPRTRAAEEYGTSLPFVDASTRDVGVSGDTLPGEDQPAAPADSSTGSESRGSPSADGSTASRGTQRPASPQPPPVDRGWAHPLTGLLAEIRANAPGTVAAGATEAEYRTIMTWARDFQRAYQTAHPVPALTVVPDRAEVAPRFKHPSKRGR